MSVFAVGDTVIMAGVNWRDRIEEVPVVRVGRTNVYVEDPDGGREMAFDIETRQEKGNYSHHTIYTKQEWANKQRRDTALKLMRDHNVTLVTSYGSAANELSTAKLEKLVAVLEENI